MKTKDKLKMMAIVSKFFAIVTYVMTWYGEASQDKVIDAPELIELGAGICDILGLRTNIELPVDGR